MTEAIIIPNPPQNEPPGLPKDDAEILSAKNHPEWYFDGSLYFFKLLRFLNFLEPDRVVVSMTKVMLWAATFQTIMVISTSHDPLTVCGALGLNVATMVKHEVRRKNENAAGSGGATVSD